MINRIARNFGGTSVFAGVGERTREGNDLWVELTEADVLKDTALVFGQMDEPPGTRMRVALSALTMAEYFRDEQNQDVLLFIDNIFRFTQAGSEVSTLLGRMPSAVGYQPTLADEMGELQERITSTRGRSITSMQAVYVPADDYTDPAPATTFAHLDATTELSRPCSPEGHLPGGGPAGLDARDPGPAVVGDEHYRVAQEVMRILQRYKDLQDIIAILGIDELSEEDKQLVGPGPAHRALPVAEHDGGRAVHRSAGLDRAAQGDDRVVRQDRQGRVRPRARAGVLPLRRPGGPGAQPQEAGGRRRARMAEMTVEIVAVERRIWSGKATFVFARTTVGEIGILPGHEQTLAQLEEAGIVRIDGVDGPSTTAAVHGGFLHVTPESVTILAESAEIGSEVDVARARSALSRADGSEPEGAAAAARAEVRLKAAGAE